MAACIPPSPLISSSHPYSVLAKCYCFSQLSKMPFLQCHKNIWGVTRITCSPCPAFDCVPSPLKSTCQMLICYHIKFVPCQNFFSLPFIPTVKLCTGLSLPIHHPVHLFVTLLYSQPMCLSPHKAHARHTHKCFLKTLPKPCDKQWLKWARTHPRRLFLLIKGQNTLQDVQLLSMWKPFLLTPLSWQESTEAQTLCSFSRQQRGT